MKLTPQISEANVSKAIQDLLSAKRILWYRMNASKQLLSYTNKAGQTKRRMLRGHKPGTADLLALISTGVGLIETLPRVTTADLPADNMVALWLEVKAPGKKQSPAQIEFQREVEAYGMTYLLVDNIDTLIDWLSSRGW